MLCEVILDSTVVFLLDTRLHTNRCVYDYLQFALKQLTGSQICLPLTVARSH